MRALLSWSSGKDSAWALDVLRRQRGIEIVGLLTTFNAAVDRVAMHAVRRELVERQAAAAGLPLWPVELPWPCSNEAYEARMREVIARAREQEIEAIAFGDLFLEDVRAYRERMLAGSGIEPLFPLWTRPEETPRLARTMIAAGLRAIVTCVDPGRLPARFVGREYTVEWLAELPPEVDPCGERGEFHSFCFDGPMFSRAIPVRAGAVVERDGFCFADVLPEPAGPAAATARS